MSDAPTPDPASSTPPPKRPWTILGRLSKAVREQNWFAVVLEVCIVVLGVVIGFQVTSWGQERGDRAKEKAYLHQLVEDLLETENAMRQTDAFAGENERATGRLLASFGVPERPPPDSAFRWLGLMRFIESPRPVLGTARALVASGDLSLIRDDELRSAITSYLDISDENIEFMQQNSENGFVLGRQAGALVNLREIGSDLPRERQELLRRFGHPALMTELVGSERSLGPDDLERFFGDPEAYTLVTELGIMHANMAHHRGTLLDAAGALRQQIEAELDP